ncbi:5-hydroxytryptamine receptor 3A-like [Sinocyclocheilus anshuiensis]|uniref:5-hydroxytryptamine receptor 3A-like n=1 Tax=Sinocyclocheilus anshuiensis TaxID=1608454 RepID=UPI0007B7F4E3|nr:PREDICTED: 5-hydroxytryptamine receptor 3A-like [Sinocyclocheilus anshuiensis]
MAESRGVPLKQVSRHAVVFTDASATDWGPRTMGMQSQGFGQVPNCIGKNQTHTTEGLNSTASTNNHSVSKPKDWSIASANGHNASGWVSDAKNCNNTENAAAYDALFEHLGLDKNDNQKRPLYYGDATHVFVELYVTSIIDVDEKAQSLTIQVKMITAWININMDWNSHEFCGMNTFSARKDMVWTPDIVIAESIKTDFGTKESPYVQFYCYAFTVLSDILVLTTACKMDLHKFPFDIHSCNLTLQSSAYSIEELKVLTFADSEWVTHESKQTFQAQGEWELLSINMVKSNISVGYEWDMKDQLIYQITIKRRPLLYVINIILPVFFFLVLDVMSFFIDGRGTDKLSFKVTLLLSFSVLLLILNDTLPSTADKIPLIGIYCSVIFSLIGFSILETILVNFLMARGAENRPAASIETTTAGILVIGGVSSHLRLIMRSYINCSADEDRGTM